MTPDELFAEHTPHIAKLAARVRQIITTATPESHERVYPGWHGLGYVHPEAGYICGIFPRDAEVRLGFEHGALLPDPDQLLTEGGGQVRYVVISEESSIDATAISDLVADAIELRSN